MMTVMELKLIYDVYEKLPANEVRLVYGGRQLQDKFFLHHYNLRDGATLHVILKIRGD